MHLKSPDWKSWKSQRITAKAEQYYNSYTKTVYLFKTTFIHWTFVKCERHISGKRLILLQILNVFMLECNAWETKAIAMHPEFHKECYSNFLQKVIAYDNKYYLLNIQS